MKIGIDITPLESPHKFRGVGSYIKNLTDSLKKSDKENEYIFFTKGQKLPKVDLIHYPYFDLFFLTLPIFKQYPCVVTVYDVIPLIFPKQFTRGIRGSLKFQIQKLSLRGVNRVITISECSRKDIAKYLSVPNEKIDVVYLAPNPIFKPITNHQSLIIVKNKYNLPKHFALYVGDVNYNKNLQALFEALSKVKIPLVMVGEAVKNDNLAQTKDLMNLAKKLGIQDRILRLGFIADQELVSIYNLATFCIQPSLYEGFGLPVLEAMVCGTPVVSSNTSSLLEVVGDAAILVDPESVDSIVKGIETILGYYNSDHDRYEVLRKRGFEQAKKFSWEETAGKTIKVYKKSND